MSPRRIGIPPSADIPPPTPAWLSVWVLPRGSIGCGNTFSQAVGTGAGLCCARPWANLGVHQHLPWVAYRDGAWQHRQQHGAIYQGSARAEIKTCGPDTAALLALRYEEDHFVLVANPFLFVYHCPELAPTALPWIRYCFRDPVQTTSIPFAEASLWLPADHGE